MGILDNTKYIFKICEMYYHERLTQKEIASVMGISRSQVSRIIDAASERNLVTVQFNYPNSFEAHYQTLIKEKYDIDSAVFDLGDSSGDAEARLLAAKAADYISMEMKRGYKVGVMSSTTIKYVAESMPASKDKGLAFVPLCGGYSINGASWYANAIVQEMASKTNSKYYLFSMPCFVKSVQAKDIIMEEPNIKQIFELISQCDICLVGIGNVDLSSSGILAEGLTADDLEALRSLHAVASICASFLDREGNIVKTSFSERMIGASLSEVRNSKVFGIASGAEKADAIKAALKGKAIDVLFTSLETARHLVE